MSEITRIVRLSFHENHTADFLAIFEKSAPSIRSFTGCIEVKLMQDYHDPSVYFTISRWENHESLENYRNSELFRNTWAETKSLFKEKALAYSMVSKA